MKHEMPKLPYQEDSLQPVISKETIEYHYGKHLQAYVNNLNTLIAGTEFEDKNLEEIIKTAPEGGHCTTVYWENRYTSCNTFNCYYIRNKLYIII